MTRLKVSRDSGSMARPWRVSFKRRTVAECESWGEAMGLARIIIRSGVLRM